MYGHRFLGVVPCNPLYTTGHTNVHAYKKHDCVKYATLAAKQKWEIMMIVIDQRKIRRTAQSQLSDGVSCFFFFFTKRSALPDLRAVLCTASEYVFGECLASKAWRCERGYTQYYYYYYYGYYFLQISLLCNLAQRISR